MIVRPLLIAAGLAAGLASAAPAATVASFQGTASASLTLLSATFSDTGEAAGDHVYWLYGDDEDAADAGGDAYAFWDYCADSASCLANSGEIGGTAALGAPADAFSYGHLDFALFYDACAACTSAVTLSFDYSVAVTGGSGVTGLGTAWIDGYAEIRAGSFGPVAASFTGPRALSGSFDLLLQPGEDVFLGTGFSLQGAASVVPQPASVPLPASLPLLLAGMAGLGLWSRRRG